MIAADWGYAIPGAMVTAGAIWLIGDVIIDGARNLWMDHIVRHTKIVEGAGAGDRPRTAATPSTPHAEPVALPVYSEASPSRRAPFDSGISVYDWATEHDAPLYGAHDSMAGGTDEEAALADSDRRFAAIVRGESARIHPSAGGAA